MKKIEDLFRSLQFDALGQGAHKISPEALFDDPDGFLVDLRTEEEYRMFNFPLAGKSLHLPLAELPDRWREIPADRPVGLLCFTCVRSSMAFVYLRALGLNNVYVFTAGCGGVVEAMKTEAMRKRQQ